MKGIAQETDPYLLWAHVAPAQFSSVGTIVNQSDMDDEGNIYVIGTYFKNSFLQIFLIKYDKDGNVVWTKEYGNQEYYSLAGDIRVDKDGNIIFTAIMSDPEGKEFGKPLHGCFLSKMDKDGNILWVSDISQARLFTYGERVGTFSHQSHMEIDSDNSIVLYYDANPPGSIRTPAAGLYISRYSSSGQALDHFQITRDDNFDPPIIGGLAIDGDGNFIITGSYHVGLNIGPLTFGTPGPQSPAPVQLFIAKYSRTGQFLWAKEMNGALSLGYDVETDESNHIYLTGLVSPNSTFGDDPLSNNSNPFGAFLAKISPTGQLVWLKPFNAATNVLNSSDPISMKRTSSGEIYITGACIGGISYGDFSMRRIEQQGFVLKLNPDASFNSVMVSNGAPLGLFFRYAWNSTIDDEGNVYTIGNFNKRVVFGCDTLRTEENNMFIVKYSQFPPSYELSISGPDNACDGTTLGLTASVIPEPVKYIWNIPPGVTTEPSSDLSSRSIAVQIDQSANFKTIDVAVRKGCYQYETNNPYTIKIQPLPGDTYPSGTDLFCQPGNSRFYAGSANHASSYVWTLPSGIVPLDGSFTTTEPFIDVNITEDLTQGFIVVKSTNICGEGKPSSAMPVELLPKPSPVTFLSEEDQFCNRGQTVTFEIAISEGATEYVWDIPSNFIEAGTIVSDAQKVTLTLKESGMGVLSVQSRNRCLESIATKMNIKVSAPLAVPLIQKNECETELFVEGEQNVYWVLNDVVVAEGKTYQPSDPGEYYATVSNFCGTVASQGTIVMPVTEDVVLLSNVITPNNDGKNDLFILSDGIANLKLEIFNRWGSRVFISKDYQNDWDGRDLPAGTYYFQMEHPCIPTRKGWIQLIK